MTDERPYFNSEDDCWYLPPITFEPNPIYEYEKGPGYIRFPDGKAAVVMPNDIKWPDPATANMTIGTHPVITREEDMIYFGRAVTHRTLEWRDASATGNEHD